MKNPSNHTWRRRVLSGLILLALVAAAPGAEINLLAMGDWGGGSQQRAVAAAMADYVRRSGAEFSGMLLAGDNFYVKLTGIDDPQWRTLFEDMYDPQHLNFPFYVSLGNHDLENGKMAIEMAYADANPSSRWKMPGRWYRVDLPAEAPIVSILMLDSNKQGMTAGQWNDQLEWMDAQLAIRPGNWMVAVAHHPLFSNGDHGDNGVLQRQWKPLFNRHKLDAYICGHDHDLQHIEIPTDWPSFLLVGGGGKNIRPMRLDARGPFSKSAYGFAHLTFTESAMHARLVDQRGFVLHRFERHPDGRVHATRHVPSDVAVPRNVKSVTRPDLPATAPREADDKVTR